MKVEHGGNFSLNEKTGILTLRTKIGPGKMNMTEFGYTDEYPNYKPVTLE